jgi:putative tryptophan/tyrosine transport system substrate-binding protein
MVLRTKTLFCRYAKSCGRLVIWFACCAAPLLTPAAGTGSIAVVYPDIAEPSRSIFAKIIEGIEVKTKSRIWAYPVGVNLDMPTLNEELRRQDIRVVIALGRNGLKVANGLSRDISVVAGGIINAPESDTLSFTVHSLAPDPRLLFERLKSLSPQTKRVFVVYDAKQNAWLMRLAMDAARVHGLELVAMEAIDLKTASRVYQELIANADPKKDALWLPQDTTTVEESSVLPMILLESWNRSLPVFSSNVGHVRRGALFALYPNNLGLGQNLAQSAISQLNATGHPTRSVTPLRDVLAAVNTRTANHLGLNLSGRAQQSFDMVFPEQ